MGTAALEACYQLLIQVKPDNPQSGSGGLARQRESNIAKTDNDGDVRHTAPHYVLPYGSGEVLGGQ
jgi:hypothetical protein